MIDVRCGNSVQCGDSKSGAVVCTMTVTGWEYARLVAIAGALNALASGRPGCGCVGDNTPASVFAGFFANCIEDLGDINGDFVARGIADGGDFCGGEDSPERRYIAGRLADAIRCADDVFAHGRRKRPLRAQEVCGRVCCGKEAL